MGEKVRKALFQGWSRLVQEERGAQTLEYLALALLIVAILGVSASFAQGGSGVGDALADWFKAAIEKLKP
ncbi:MULTISPECIES: hypothetical protein [Symbiobacterium]|uniref:Uncharacterized protein n=1 Tax=Symbiobacterium thermophilum TaxID=2734 RepID=A0A953LJ90_SYMTR|nr:hypothetical protein [Symbiobacterium thermophilum]MBY6278046.1 hypothetical protein [Symbiobacterium thermophilum]PZN69430.1 MAG: hypothetical protein DIU55_12975 [Bacillota bacterium]